MLNLNDREWKTFNLIGDNMFYIDDVKTFKSTALVESDGVFDIVGATSKNNGNVGFLPKQYSDYLTNGNCICLIKTGQGSVGDAVYKQGAFIPSNNVCVIRSSWLNRYNGMFIVAEINKQADRYSYGYIRNNSRIRKEQLMLPTADDGQPDYIFMEQYIREREDKLKQKYIDFVKAELETPPTPLEEKKWGEFFIGALFKVKRPKARSEKDYKEGSYPFVASGNFNNGVIRYCELRNESPDKGNCITVSPVDGSAFYQKGDFLGRGGAGSSILLLYCANINEYSGMFIARLIRQTCSKYNYGKMGNQDSIKRERILLPITDDGNPDYEYMEQYIKALMFGKYKKYLEYQNCLIP